MIFLVGWGHRAALPAVSSPLLSKSIKLEKQRTLVALVALITLVALISLITFVALITLVALISLIALISSIAGGAEVLEALVALVALITVVVAVYSGSCTNTTSQMTCSAAMPHEGFGISTFTTLFAFGHGSDMNLTESAQYQPLGSSMKRTRSLVEAESSEGGEATAA